MQEEDDPKYTANAAREFFMTQQWDVLDWHCHSPDLSPAEQVCHSPKIRPKAKVQFIVQVRHRITRGDISVLWDHRLQTVND